MPDLCWSPALHADTVRSAPCSSLGHEDCAVRDHVTFQLATSREDLIHAVRKPARKHGLLNVKLSTPVPCHPRVAEPPHSESTALSPLLHNFDLQTPPFRLPKEAKAKAGAQQLTGGYGNLHRSISQRTDYSGGLRKLPESVQQQTASALQPTTKAGTASLVPKPIRSKFLGKGGLT